MALTNPYCSLADVKTELGETSTAYDTKLETAINAASRFIDKQTGRRRHGFWQDSAVTVRYYEPEDGWCCEIPEGISTLTGLIVKIDTNLDGSYATTLTYNTDFTLEPYNAVADGEPFTEIEILRSTSSWSFPIVDYGRPSVQVTAKFGWPAIPDDIKKACIIRAVYEFKASDVAAGGAGAINGPTGGIIAIDDLLEGYTVQYA